MADTTPQMFQTQRSGGGSEKGDDDSSSLIISTLPTREGWWAAPLFHLHGCWLTARLARSVELVQAEFKPRPDDILLATFPKSGTTWLKALAFTVTNRSRHPIIITGDNDHPHHHPLLSSNPHDLVPFLELPDRSLRPVAELEALPSPRLLCTHLPPALLPAGMLMTSSRAVYLCREPKDVFVSFWHHVRTLIHESLVEFDKAFELFCEGVSVEFLGVPFTEEEESGGVVEEVVRLCSFQNLKDLPDAGDGTQVGLHR